MDSKQYLYETEFDGSATTPATDYTPEELQALDAALYNYDARTVENLLRSDPICGSIDFQAIALYLLVSYNCEKNAVALALSIFKISYV